MALIYEYEDTFVTNSIDEATHEKAESDALIDAGKQNVTDEFYLEKVVVAMVYVTLCGLQIEADGISEKESFYRKEYDRSLRMSRHADSDAGAFNVSIGRS